MELRRFKTLFLLIFTFLTGLIFFLPGDAEASFINFQTWARKRDADGGYSPAYNVAFTLDSTRDSSYKWSESNGTCHGCDGEKKTVTTTTYDSVNGTAYARSANSGNIACGNSVCASGDAGTCNPFKLKGSIDGSGYDAGLSTWSVSGTGDNASGSGFTVDTNFGNMTNSIDPNWYVTFNRRFDNLSVSLNSAIVDSSNQYMDCLDNKGDPTDGDGILVTFNATHSHTSNFPHGVGSYVWDFNTSSSTDAIVTTSSSTIDHRYKYDELTTAQKNTLITTGKVNVTAKVNISCDDPGVRKNVPDDISVELKRADRRLYCYNLTTVPERGNVPLTVTFTADVRDNWCLAPTSDVRYGWDFFGDGFDKNNLVADNDRITTTPSTIYTYILENVAGYRPSVSAWLNSNPSIQTQDCPYVSTINSQNFSDTNYQEVAP